MTAAPFVLHPSAFGELLVRRNGLAEAGFAAWDLLPGMRFGDAAAWWRAGAPRASPHEGLDLSGYRTRDGARRVLGAGARVPALWAGRVVSVVADFLGRSVFVEHDRLDGDGRRLHTIFGHVRPAPGVRPGSALGEGAEIGTVSAGTGRPGGVPPHLHLTIALIARDGGPSELDWTAMRDRARVLLLDPLPVVCGAGSGGRR